MQVAMRGYGRMGLVRAPELDFHPDPGVTVKAYRLDLGADGKAKRRKPAYLLTSWRRRRTVGIIEEERLKTCQAYGSILSLYVSPAMKVELMNPRFLGTSLMTGLS
jgi:hypothetical protein